MHHLSLVIAALFSLLFLPTAGPLLTRWAKDVSPEKALPEYPRPQMVRQDWLNLNGPWDITLAGGAPSKIAPTNRGNQPRGKQVLQPDFFLDLVLGAAAAR